MRRGYPSRRLDVDLDVLDGFFAAVPDRRQYRRQPVAISLAGASPPIGAARPAPVPRRRRRLPPAAAGTVSVAPEWTAIGAVIARIVGSGSGATWVYVSQNRATSSGSNCVPAWRRSSRIAFSWLIDCLYGRSWVIAS